jgi:bifunctional non-homologous end joining protein LigD
MTFFDTINQKPDLIVEATDPLTKYKNKRKFDETSEPEGKATKGGNKHRFVIQLHHAKKAGDHYDVRLENDNGTLSSWSVPKHRLPKGKEKLLAIKTEDHPIEYLKFKGEIPTGYGAGVVEVYDSGTYEELETSKTKIVFKLKGKKEKGIYRLFRAGEGQKWMIMAGTNKKEASDILPLSKWAVKTKHTGAMLALMAPPDIIRKMRKAGIVKNKDISKVLHLTLLYLGESSKLKKATLESIQKATEKVCARHSPLKMSISGAGLFISEEDGIPVFVVPNAKGLSALQADLENVIGSIIDLPSEHGWVPHMTVDYSCDDKPELPDLTEPLTWTANKVRFQVGGEKMADIPIGSKKRADVCFPISKRAVLDRLPIAHDPAMWTNEQLMEAIKRPELFENDKERYQAVIQQLAKRQLIKRPEPKEMEQWREQGYWLLAWGGVPLAFFDNEGTLDMARRLLINDFAENGKLPDEMVNHLQPSYLAWRLESTIMDFDIWADPSTEESKNYASSKTKSQVERAINELLSHPMRKRHRRTLAESALNSSKAPMGFTPDPGAIPSGNRPTRDNSNAAGDSITDRNGQGKQEFMDTLVDSQEQAAEALDEFVSDSAEQILSRLKAEEKGLDPEKLADDDIWTDEDDNLELTLTISKPLPLSERQRLESNASDDLPFSRYIKSTNNPTSVR